MGKILEGVTDMGSIGVLSIEELISKHIDDVIKIRRTIHENPELRLK